MKQTILPPQKSLAEMISAQGIIAIVDDDPHVANALGMWIELHGMHGTQHLSGESLLQAIQQVDDHLTVTIGISNPVAFPLVGAVLDLNLPGITGIELAQSLLRLAPKLPLVLITALNEEDRVRYGNPPPGIRCLKKPFDLDELEDALFSMLH